MSEDLKSKNLYDYDISDVSRLIGENIDAVIIVDPSIDAYKTIVRRGMFDRSDRA